MFLRLSDSTKATGGTVSVVSDTGVAKNQCVHKPIPPAPQFLNHATPQSVNTISIHDAEEPLHSTLKDAAVPQEALELTSTCPQHYTISSVSESEFEIFQRIIGELDRWKDAKAAVTGSQYTAADSRLHGKLEEALESILKLESNAPQEQDASRNSISNTVRAILVNLDIAENYQHLDSMASKIEAAQEQNILKNRNSNTGVPFGVYLGALLLACYVALKCAGHPYPFTISSLAVGWLSVLGRAISRYM